MHFPVIALPSALLGSRGCQPFPSRAVFIARPRHTGGAKKHPQACASLPGPRSCETTELGGCGTSRCPSPPCRGQSPPQRKGPGWDCPTPALHQPRGLGPATTSHGSPTQGGAGATRGPRWALGVPWSPRCLGESLCATPASPRRPSLTPPDSPPRSRDWAEAGGQN